MYFKRDFRPQKGLCFVLMPFGQKELSDGRMIDWDERYKEVLEPAITDSGMRPSRADDIYGTQPLIDRIWRGIQEAEVIIAELTGRSPNVMYEIGLAHLIGKRLVLLTMNPDDVPTDLAQSVQIRYSDQGIGLLQLTRELQANLEAARAEPVNEAMLAPLQGGEIEVVPARVEFVAPTYVTVRTDSNRMGFLHREDVSYARVIRDMQKIFRVSQQLNGAFVFNVDGEARYSLVAGEDNPWPKLLSEFPEGSTFTGVVKSSVENIGAFVPVAYGINGLIHRSALEGIAGGMLKQGDQVEVRIRQISQSKRQVELELRRVISRTHTDDDDDDEWQNYPLHATFFGKVHRVVQDRGFILVSLPPGRAGLLNVNKMSEGFRRRFDEGAVAVGDSVNVEIAEVQPHRNRIILRDTES